MDHWRLAHGTWAVQAPGMPAQVCHWDSSGTVPIWGPSHSPSGDVRFRDSPPDRRQVRPDEAIQPFLGTFPQVDRSTLQSDDMSRNGGHSIFPDGWQVGML